MQEVTTKEIYSGFWRRAAAQGLDTIVLIIITILLHQIVSEIQVRIPIEELFTALYFILLEGSRRQASLGKSIMKIYVATTDGKRMPISQNLFRYLIWSAPGIPVILLMLSPSYSNFFDTLHHLHEVHDTHATVAYVRSPEGKVLMSRFWYAYSICILGDLFLNALPIIFTKEKTGLHDYLSKTRVYKKQVGE
jgi:uncharacterized RDD family membrane protein YckC